MQERFESLSVDEDDEAPYRRRSSAARPRFYNYLLAVLALFMMGTYGVWHYTDLPERLKGTMPEPVHPLTLPPKSRPPALDAQAQQPAQLAEQPRPLAECIGANNVIDSDVARCRFGKLPPPVHNSSAQGMVSNRYMAQYRADQQRAAVRHPQPSFVVWTRIRQWDGAKSYPARWTITDNRIEGTSVCTNLPKGSIDYRECRKGAKVHFRDQCRKLNKSGTRDEDRQRYCSAAEVFNPLG